MSQTQKRLRRQKLDNWRQTAANYLILNITDTKVSLARQLFRIKESVLYLELIEEDLERNGPY